MPDLIVIRLHPSKPIAADAFTDYLKNLTITAFDISFDKLKGEQIGQPAQYLPDDLQNSRIAQNFSYKLEPEDKPTQRTPVMHATGTAIIEVPSNRKEYDSSDIYLKIERNGKEIIDHNIYYNVLTVFVDNIPTPVNPKIILAPPALPPNPAPNPAPIPDPFALEPVSIYLALPSSGLELDPKVAYVDLPTDGTPPSFASLKEAVKRVLRKDPDTVPDPPNDDPFLDQKIAQLTPDQCRHIANEIVWNRHIDPPPTPSLPVGDLYTNPLPPKESDISNFPVDPQEAEQERNKFEAEQPSYEATHNAEAERLSQYVFALSAAIYCQQKTENAKRVGFQFPVLPVNASDPSKIQEAKVVLFNKP